MTHKFKAAVRSGELCHPQTGRTRQQERPVTWKSSHGQFDKCDFGYSMIIQQPFSVFPGHTVWTHKLEISVGTGLLGDLVSALGARFLDFTDGLL